MSELLLVEDVALLLLSDDTGWMRGQYHELVLAGAMATELAIRGRIRLTEKGEREVRKGRVVVSDTTPTDDAILDQALERLARRPVRWRSTTIQVLRKNAKRLVLERLSERGLVEAREHRESAGHPQARRGAAQGALGRRGGAPGHPGPAVRRCRLSSAAAVLGWPATQAYRN